MHDADAVEQEPWRARLDALLVERMNVPFEWGKNDCCIFAADAALAITTQDFAASERGSYATAKDAAARISALGGLSEIVDRHAERVAPTSAMFGDIGLIESGGRESLGVCTGTSWLTPSSVGLAASAFDSAVIVWRLVRG